jgi:U3 small nucleolar RNA-associated protein 20
MICKIDAFHFDFGSDADECAVTRGLNRRIIPKVEALLTKKVDGKGTFLRPTVAIALLKLFQKLPNDVFLIKFNRLLKVVCNELRNKDSNARDVARSALAKMVTILDSMKYLADVVRELAISLNEGYKLHVRTATLHSILAEIIKSDTEGKLDAKQRTEILSAVPGILDLIQKDLFDEAQERRDAEGSRVRFVKEAQGSKGVNCLEMVACLIDAGPEQNGAAMRMLVSPFLERLRDANVSTKVINTVKMSLVRLVAGLRQNSHISKSDTMSFVRATLVDFISDSDVQAMVKNTREGKNSDDEGSFKPLHVSGSRRSSEHGNDTKVTVTQWRPTMLNVPQTGKDAQARKKADEADQAKVLDGASAPKLTGSMRRPRSVNEGTIANDAKTRIAVVFCLNLLAPALKNTVSQTELHSVMDNFLPILTACACCCRDTEVVLLSFRCLSCLIRLKLPKMAQCNRAIASKSLDLLLSASGNQEQLQSTFNMLTLLITADENDNAKSALPIDTDHMPVLLSFLRESITGGDQCGHALGLLKAILGHRFISVELYDLMDAVLEQTVRNPKEAIRSQSSTVFLSFLINYPLATKKIETYMKRLVANISYDFTHGRLSAIALVASLVEKLPLALLEERNSIFFIPLALQLTNDDTPECCEALRNCIGVLLKRMQIETLQGLFEYTKKWSNQPSDALKITALHIFRLFLQQRQDFIKRHGRDSFLVETVSTLLQESALKGEVIMLALDLIVDLRGACKSIVDGDFLMWNALVQFATRDELSIRLKACTILDSHFASIKAEGIEENATPTFLTKQGALFQVGRAMCLLVDRNDETDSSKMTALVVKLLTWILTAMHACPSLCTKPDEEEKANDPVYWVMRRLSGIAKPKGIKRKAVFKCFASFAVQCGDFVYQHIELMLEPLCRSETENNNETAKSMYSGFDQGLKANIEDEPASEAQLVKEVLMLLEEKCPDASLFLSALSSVKTRALEKREKRKIEQKSEAVTNPQVFAQKKIAKQQRETSRRKRTVDSFRSERGSKAKRRHF